MTQEIVYNYIDGNGNKFVIKAKSIEYNPVKPAFSSSGLYDGGDYVKKKITNVQYDEIIAIINEAVRKKEYHIKNRVKLSGMIIINDGSNEKIYILAPLSEHVINIEKKLKKIVNI
ncbi:MAG: hypothetical protein ACFFBP_20840 [Promethearchaeota archaeon]